MTKDTTELNRSEANSSAYRELYGKAVEKMKERTDREKELHNKTFHQELNHAYNHKKGTK